jgi:hypothetical protein
VQEEAKQQRCNAIEKTTISEATARVLALAGIGPERQAELAELCLDHEMAQEVSSGGDESDVAGAAHT